MGYSRVKMGVKASGSSCYVNQQRVMERVVAVKERFVLLGPKILILQYFLGCGQ
jgi:hypothetical protein